MAVKFIYIVISLALLTIVGWLYTNQDTSLGGGFDYISGRADNTYITHKGERVIYPTIIDVDKQNSYVSGIRLHVDYLNCHENGFKIRVGKQAEYFILDTQTAETTTFNKRHEFDERLDSLGLTSSSVLNEDLIASSVKHYENLYENISFDGCIKVSLNRFE